jgi:hypothetical protein
MVTSDSNGNVRIFDVNSKKILMGMNKNKTRMGGT